MAIAATKEVMRARQNYLDKVRMKVGLLAELAFSLPDSPTRTRLMHTPFGELVDEFSTTYAPVHGLHEVAARTPYGFARFWGRLKVRPLLDLPAVLDACEDDLTPL